MPGWKGCLTSWAQCKLCRYLEISEVVSHLMLFYYVMSLLLHPSCFWQKAPHPYPLKLKQYLTGFLNKTWMELFLWKIIYALSQFNRHLLVFPQEKNITQYSQIYVLLWWVLEHLIEIFLFIYHRYYPSVPQLFNIYLHISSLI